MGQEARLEGCSGEDRTQGSVRPEGEASRQPFHRASVKLTATRNSPSWGFRGRRDVGPGGLGLEKVAEA